MGGASKVSAYKYGVLLHRGRARIKRITTQMWYEIFKRFLSRCYTAESFSLQIQTSGERMRFSVRFMSVSALTLAFGCGRSEGGSESSPDCRNIGCGELSKS